MVAHLLSACEATTVVIDLTKDIIDLTEDDLNDRRRAVLEELKRPAASVVDLTREEIHPAPLELEGLVVRPRWFTSNSCNNTHDKTQSYTLTIDGWKDGNNGSVLSGLVDISFVIKTVLLPGPRPSPSTS